MIYYKLAQNLDFFQSLKMKLYFNSWTRAINIECIILVYHMSISWYYNIKKNSRLIIFFYSFSSTFCGSGAIVCWINVFKKYLTDSMLNLISPVFAFDSKRMKFCFSLTASLSSFSSSNCNNSSSSSSVKTF